MLSNLFGFKKIRKKQNMMEYIKIIITIIIAVGGWIFGHWLNAKRDQKNQRKEIVIKYLIDAYTKLESSANKPKTKITDDAIESSIANIHLFGTSKQIELAKNFSNSIATHGNASLDNLLLELRKDLRKELNLSPVERKLNYLRFDREHKI